VFGKLLRLISGRDKLSHMSCRSAPVALILVVASTLGACGGGGSGGGQSAQVTPNPSPSLTTPSAPTAVSISSGNGAVTLSFSAPTSNGGASITGYSVSCTGGGANRTGSGTASPITVTGLSNGTSYSCSVAAVNSVGTGAASVSVSATPTADSAANFILSSAVGIEGGVLSADYTCDGSGSSPALSWTNPPAGTQQFALMMTTLPGDGTTKWNWVLHDIPAATRSLGKDSFGPGTLGVGSDGPYVGYQPPCSQGPGAKVYTFTLYALSAAPTLPQSGPVSGSALSSAIADITLGTATLNLSYTRPTNASGSTTACGLVRSSLSGSTTGSASVACDTSYAYISSNSLPTHPMMNGITASNLQVPLAQNFFGANGWKIPLNPSIAATTTSAVDGPIGVAVNGVLIFNPCKQGGCQNGDVKVLGELDACNGHAGRADDYHYHAAPICLMQGRASNYWDTHPVGWALDGFAIYGYNDANGQTAARDSVCGGNTTTVSNGPQGYSYHVTDASPYVLACFRGTPSPDLASQSSKFSPIRQPPVQPFKVSNMSLNIDPSDGYQVLQFSSAVSFTTNETGTDSYSNPPGVYRIRYKQLSGASLATALAAGNNSNKTACWNFVFTDTNGNATQPSITYCR
jgi:phosphatidylethanolamine-binding protein (PEBP) family uncharacterized protein